MSTPFISIVEIEHAVWRWEFRDAKGELAASSAKAYPGEQHCRDAIRELQDARIICPGSEAR